MRNVGGRNEGVRAMFFMIGSVVVGLVPFMAVGAL